MSNPYRILSVRRHFFPGYVRATGDGIGSDAKSSTGRRMSKPNPITRNGWKSARDALKEGGWELSIHSDGHAELLDSMNQMGKHGQFTTTPVFAYHYLTRRSVDILRAKHPELVP